jgi:GTP-binding protein HflX
VGRTYQRITEPNPATLIGKGKLDEVLMLRDEADANLLIFDEELSPRQQRELEKAAGERTRVLDRTVLILDIFARHAATREGALQVELAQYEYRLPRLTRAWTHLARQAGGAAGRGGTGGVGLRGPGETQMEVDRREIRRRIAYLKRELEEVRTHRRLYRERRQHAGIPVVAIVGYTNAGKSTLLNALSDAGVYAADQLFATLDPTTRRVSLPGGRQVLVTDTVGFIQKLPTTLIAAFRATLEEIAEADLLLHVVDITHANSLQQVAAVGETLAEIGATGKPIISVLNKIDKLDSPSKLKTLLSEFPNAVPISAERRLGLDDLLARIEAVLAEMMVPLTVRLPYREGELAAAFHRHGIVDREEFQTQGTLITGRLPAHLVSLYNNYRVTDRKKVRE